MNEKKISRKKLVDKLEGKRDKLEEKKEETKRSLDLSLDASSERITWLKGKIEALNWVLETDVVRKKNE